MSDTFWIQFFGFFAMIFTTIMAAVVKYYADKKKTDRIEQKLDIGNDATFKILPAVTEQVGSATRKADEAVSNSKEVAEKVAVSNALNQERMTASVNKLATAIKGDDGTCVTSRLSSLEAVVNDLKQGHAEINQKLDRLSQAIEHKGSFI